MNWNDLAVFIAIADSGSLNGAAKQLGVNHSTVFRRLGELEASLNARLFERLPQGYVLTALGDRMLQLSRDAEDAINKIQLEIAGQELEPAGKVKVTTAPNLARTILPQALKQLRKSNPLITVEISVGDSDYDLNRREADIALRATPNPPDNLVGKQLMSLSWWVCSDGRKPRDLKLSKQLQGANLIGADNSMMRLPVFRWLETNYGDQIVARANDLSTMAALAQQGVGLAVLPSDQQERGLKRLFKASDFSGQLWILTHPDLRFAPRIRAVWGAIESAAAACDLDS
ncbi:MAG: LysR family transcriptional regulator [Pseudomonadales bacterium]|nr:LysR family transcriptional regulator [Pseudomonadales bacterium]